jgi:hypothetical protein
MTFSFCFVLDLPTSFRLRPEPIKNYHKGKNQTHTRFDQVEKSNLWPKSFLVFCNPTANSWAARLHLGSSTFLVIAHNHLLPKYGRGEGDMVSGFQIGIPAKRRGSAASERRRVHGVQTPCLAG